MKNITLKEAEKGPEKTSGKTVYITIDDGPSKYTDQMLKILEKYNAKATFFMINGDMKAYPQQVKNIANSTSTAGFHSVTHDVKQLYKAPDAAKKEFDQCSKTYTDITGKTSKVIRIPFGSKPYTTQASYDNMVAAGYKIWDWNVDTNDWRGNAAQIMNVVKTYGNGHNVIILMHEKPQTLEAFDALVKYYADNGYWRGNAAQIMNVVKTYGNGHNVIILMHEKPQTLEAFDALVKYYADNGYEFAAVGQNEKPKNFWLQNLSLN